MNNDRNDLRTLKDLLEPGSVVMLTTVDGDGMVARPMSLEDVDDAGRLWFFAQYDSPKRAQLEADPRVLVTLSGKNYVSVQGTGKLVRDAQRQQELWNKPAEAWLQCEPTDPRVGLVVVEATGAEYWETPGLASAAIGVVLAAVRGESPRIGENETLTLP